MARITLALLGFFLIGCQSRLPDACPDIPPTQVNQFNGVDWTWVNFAPRRNHQRQQAIEQRWQDICPGYGKAAIPGSKQQNLVCYLPSNQHPGKSAKLVIAAHYDKVRAGQGVADNWSGITVITALLQHFRQHPAIVDIEIIAFGEEEPGMLGSKAYLHGEDPKNILAMVNIDTIGLGPLVLDSRSDQTLRCRAKGLAERMGIKTDHRYLRSTIGDWAPFKARHIPVLNVHSITRDTLHRIHHHRDRAGNVDLRRLDETYQMLVNLIQQVELTPR